MESNLKKSYLSSEGNQANIISLKRPREPSPYNNGPRKALKCPSKSQPKSRSKSEPKSKPKSKPKSEPKIEPESEPESEPTNYSSSKINRDNGPLVGDAVSNNINKHVIKPGQY